MKISSVITMLTISLCASLCCTGEDEPGIDYISETDNLITVDNNENSFSLNEQIIIETVIPDSIVTTNGITISLSELFYDDTLETSFLQHSLTLYKQTGFGTLARIEVTEADILVDTGEIDSLSNSITVRNFYDASTNSFRSRFSINLQETGTFFLANTRFSSSDFRQIIISGGVYEIGFIEILSSIENANSDGGYQFVVTE